MQSCFFHKENFESVKEVAKRLEIAKIDLERECDALREQLKVQAEETEMARSEHKMLSTDYHALKESITQHDDSEIRHQKELEDLKRRPHQIDLFE